MGLFEILFDDEKNEKKKKNIEDLEKEMDLYDLDEWEKEEVRDGNYEPEDFNDDDLTEDDYYYEEQ